MLIKKILATQASKVIERHLALKLEKSLSARPICNIPLAIFKLTVHCTCHPEWSEGSPVGEILRLPLRFAQGFGSE